MAQLLSALPQFDNLMKLVLRFPGPQCDDTLFSVLGSLHLDSLELEVLSASLGNIPIQTRVELIFIPSSSPVQVGVSELEFAPNFCLNWCLNLPEVEAQVEADLRQIGCQMVGWGTI
ncbi:hypothetical protein C8F04DRAFT_1196819 [Mycena alexandri]|uniref:Uncharacterized protein n=1 Tax=Mycena alexandri TaxID=1745969 RepID=A0AAD6S4A3_9AGAR|nr:hypothetical protein C8F04DRAFT_1196819 [Mycena alexandri]